MEKKYLQFLYSRWNIVLRVGAVLLGCGLLALALLAGPYAPSGEVCDNWTISLPLVMWGVLLLSGGVVIDAPGLGIGVKVPVVAVAVLAGTACLWITSRCRTPCLDSYKIQPPPASNFFRENQTRSVRRAWPLWVARIWRLGIEDLCAVGAILSFH